MNLNPDPNILYLMKPTECNNSTLHHKPFLVKKIGLNPIPRPPQYQSFIKNDPIL